AALSDAETIDTPPFKAFRQPDHISLRSKPQGLSKKLSPGNRFQHKKRLPPADPSQILKLTLHGETKP
ncbi:hypothetical protein L0F63_006144, partial [Massospora cicadina]